MTEADDQEFEQLLAAQKAARRRTLVIGVGAVVLIASAATVWFATRPDPKCDRKDVEAIVSDARIPAAYIGEACKLTPSLSKGLRNTANAPPDMRSLLVAKVVADHGMTFEKVCPGGVKALAATAAAAPSKQPAMFHKVCDLSAIGVSVNDRYPVMRMALAAIVHHELKDSDGDIARAVATKILRGP